MKTFNDYFEIVKFATPETNVRLRDSNVVPKSNEIILARCMNWEDIMHLIAANSILLRNDICPRWYIPYRPFARQDRTTALTHANESKLLKDLFISNDVGAIFLDVHSNNQEFDPNIEQFAPIKFYDPFGESLKCEVSYWEPRFHLIVPDNGAKVKVPKNHFSGRITYCEKKRDPVTGKLSGFEVPEVKVVKGEALVLVDDICDGGGTFIGIAEKLQKYRPKHKLILYVTHGLFTKGLDELFKYFDRIVTTNSVVQKYESNPNFTVLDITSDEFLDRYGLL